MTKSIDNIEHTLPQVFTPACPMHAPHLLQGRQELLEDIQRTCARIGAGIVLYGDRGVGKTSVAKVAAGMFRGEVFYYSASVDDTFTSVANAILSHFADLQEPVEGGKATSAGTPAESGAGRADRRMTPTPQTIVRRLPKNPTLIVVDDFERISDPRARFAFADLAKKISDSCAQATLLIVGIAENVDDLIEGHQSLRRNVSEMHIPPLTDQDKMNIVRSGAKTLGVEFEPTAVEQIISVAGNSINSVHLLCEGAVRSLLGAMKQGRRSRPVVSLEEVRDSVHHALRANQLQVDRPEETEAARRIAN